MNNFSKRITILYIITYSLLYILKLQGIVTDLFFNSSLYAGILNLINAFTAVKLFNISFNAGASKFMIYNLGGLGIRLFGLAIAFVLVIKFLNIDEYGFILVFFLFYFISLVFEVIFYLKTAKKLT